MEPKRISVEFPKTIMAVGDAWPLLLGYSALALLAIPTLARESWSGETGAHGPLILIVAGWLFWRQLPSIRKEAAPGSLWLVALVAGLSLAMYIFGEAFDFITLIAAGLYGVGVAIFYANYGFRALRRNWFIFLFLLFAVPPPSIWVDEFTAPLKQFVSTCATSFLQLFDLPVTHEGVVIYVAQYQLLVEDACSGLNSIIGLLAITLLYIYLMRGSSWRYALALTAMAVPVAIAANIARIVILILLTYFAGNDVAQGFLHFAAGMFLFVAALLLIFLIDSTINTFRLRLGARGAR